MDPRLNFRQQHDRFNGPLSRSTGWAGRPTRRNTHSLTPCPCGYCTTYL